MNDQIYCRVQFCEASLALSALGTDRGIAVDDLAPQACPVNLVVIDDADGADPGGSKIEKGGTS